MSAIEGMPGELDIFERPVIQTGILGGNYIQYKPTALVTDCKQLEFFIPGNGDQYIDLSRTLINVKVKIVKKDGTAFAETEVVYPINNVMDSLWSDVKVEFNQKLVSDSRNMYHYRAYIEDLFNYNGTAKYSHQTASGWDRDYGDFDSHEANAGAVSRYTTFKGSKQIDLAGKLHCDIFNTSKYMLNNVDVRLTLVRNKMDTILCTTNNILNNNVSVQIMDATLWVRKVRISPSILLAHANNLNTYTAKYPYKRVEMHNYTIPSGCSRHTIENMFLGKLPTRVIIGLVDHDAFSGNFSKSPFNFKHFNANYISLFKNGEQLFSRPYTPSYTDDAHAMPYIHSFINTGNHFADDGYDVKYSEWSKGYCLYAYDLTPDLSGHEQHWCIQEQGNVRFEIGFSDVKQEAVTIVVYAEFREVMEINKNRECFTEYAKV